MFYCNNKVKLALSSSSKPKLGFLVEHIQMFHHVPDVLFMLLDVFVGNWDAKHGHLIWLTLQGRLQRQYNWSL